MSNPSHEYKQGKVNQDGPIMVCILEHFYKKFVPVYTNVDDNENIYMFICILGYYHRVIADKKCLTPAHESLSGTYCMACDFK